MSYYTVKAINAQGRPYCSSVSTMELVRLAICELEKHQYTQVVYYEDCGLHTAEDTLLDDICEFSNY